jgi:hypothetical protein
VGVHDGAGFEGDADVPCAFGVGHAWLCFFEGSCDERGAEPADFKTMGFYAGFACAPHGDGSSKKRWIDRAHAIAFLHGKRHAHECVRARFVNFFDINANSGAGIVGRNGSDRTHARVRD